MQNSVTKNIFFIICATLFCVIIWRKMTKIALESLGLIEPDSRVSYFILFLFLLLGAYFITHLQGRRSVLVSSYFIAYIGIITTTMLNAIYIPLASGVLPFQIFLPAFIMFFAFNFFQTTRIGKLHALTIITIFTILTINVFINIQTIALMSTSEENVTSSTYAILFLLPFMLCFDNKSIRYASIIVIIIALFISNKRAGFLSFSLSIVVYTLIKMKHLSLGKRILFLMALGLVLSFIRVYYLSYIENSVMVNRLETLSEDGGSGRDAVYSRTIKLIFNSGPAEMIIGHGWDSVARKTGMPAHNDFLEIIYDCGWLVAVVYIFFVFQLLKYTYRLYKNDNKYAGPMAASVVIFMIHSNVAHLVLYPEFMMAFALFWGVVAGDNSRMQTKLIRRR